MRRRRRTRSAAGIPAAGAPIRPLSPRTSPTPSGTQNTCPILIATHPPLFQEFLRAFLDRQPGFRIVGEASDEEEVHRLLVRRRPSVLVFDYDSMTRNPDALIFSLRRTAPDTRILVLSSKATDETIQRVLRAGGSGIVGKHLDAATLVRAIRSVAQGEVWATRQTLARTLQYLSTAQRSTGDAALTRRQWEIVEGVSRGLRNKEIGRKLDISEKTVKSHLNNIFRKLQVNNRFAVGLYALELHKDGREAADRNA
jgi:DNA-binding NarL/FixJ family response regulator